MGSNIRKRRTLISLVSVLILGLVIMVSWAASHAQGNDIRYGETVQGEIAPGKAQEWLFNGSSADIISINVERLSGDLEPSLFLQDSDSQPVTGVQAATGQSSATLVQVRLAKTGSFIIRVTGSGVSSGTYRLTLTLTTPAPRTPTPAPTLAREMIAGAISAGTPQSGEIGGEVFQQLWRYSGISGAVVDIRMTPTSGSLQAALVILSPNSDVLVLGTSINNGPEAGVFAFPLPFTGDYTIAARRTGQDNGRLGTSAGKYTLTITVRNSADSTLSTPLNPGAYMAGRLTLNTPHAIYRFDQGGSVALRVTLGAANRLAHLRVYNINGDTLNDFVGLSPLFVPVRLPDRGPFLLDVSAPDSDNNPTVDFTLWAYRLNATVNVSHAQPLWFGAARQSTTTNPETWFFMGKAGDTLALSVQPSEPTADSTVRVIGPDDAVLYQASMGTHVQQTFTLTADGLYEVDVRPPNNNAALTYRVQMDQIGVAGMPIDRLMVATDKEALGTAVDETLPPGSAVARWLDGTAGSVINLGLVVESGTAPLGLALQKPDGSYAAVALTTRELGAPIKHIYLDQTGRYRVIVFDPRAQISEGDQNIKYSLTYDLSSGGLLQNGQRIRGGVFNTNGLAVWTLNVPYGALVNARFTNLSPSAWSPTLYIIEPSGQVIASAQAQLGNGNVDRPEIALMGISAATAGTYTIVAAGTVNGDFASYELVADSVVPFAATTIDPIQVSITRPPVTRYDLPTVPGVQRVPVASLIIPSISPSQVPADQIRTLAFNTTVRGDIPRGVPAQLWRLNSAANVVLQLRATALSGDGPAITVWDRFGHIVAEQYAANGSTTLLNYRAVQGGQYDVIISTGLNGGRYLLTLEAASITDGALKVLDGTPMVYGQTAAGEYLVNDAENMFYFLGATNDLIALQLQRLTGQFAPTLQIINPSGRVLAEDQNEKHTATAGVTNVRLTDNGLYTVRVLNATASERSTGRYLLNLILLGGQRLRNHGAGVIGVGQTVSGFLGPDTNEGTWLFRARRGQRVSFTATGAASLAPFGLRLMDTSGQAFASQDVFLNEATIHIDDVMLPNDGVYRIQVVGGAQGSGAFALTWNTATEPNTGGPLRYGQTVNGLFTQSQAFENWVFSGTQGDLVTVSLRYVRGDKFTGAFQLRGENGLVLARVADLDDGQGARATALLPFTGSYSLTIANSDSNYTGAGVYSLSVVLQDSKARSAGSVLRYGETGRGELYVDEGQDTWIFAAHEGEKVRINLRALDRFLKPSLELRTTDGQVLASAQPDGDTARIGGDAQSDFRIEGDGVYVIAIQGAVDSATGAPTTGSYQLTLEGTLVPVVDTQLINYGDTRPGLIADDRASETFIFSGREGDTVTLNMTRESGSSLAAVLELRTLSGAVLVHADADDSDTVLIKNFKLPTTADYQIVTGRFQGATGRTSGRYSLRIEGISEDRTSRGVVRYGQTTTGRLGDDNPVDRLGFEGKAGEILGITGKPTSGDLDMVLRLYSPTGVKLAQADNTGGVTADIPSVALPADGSYVLEISRGALRSQGSYELLVSRLYQLSAGAPPQDLIPYGARVIGSVDVSSPEARYTLNGNQGDQITVQLLHQADDVPPQLAILDPSGGVLAEGKLGIGRTVIEGYTLPISGTYIISIKRPINSQQPFSPFALVVDLASALVQPASAGGVIAADGLATGAFKAGEAAHYWLFKASAGQTLTVGLLRLTGEMQPSALLIGPGGQALATLDLPARAVSGSIHYTLPTDGVYSILVVPNDARLSGSYRLSVAADQGTAAEITSLREGVPITDSLDTGDVAKRYAVQAQAGQIISARMVVTGGTLNPALHLISTDGAILAEGVLGRSGDNPSAAITGFVVPAAGTYLIVTDRQPDSAQTAGTYHLLYALESPGVAVNPSVASGRPIAYGQPVRDVIQAGSESIWILQGSEGDTVNIVSVINDVTGGPLQPTLPPPTRRFTPTPPENTPTGTPIQAGRVAPAIELQDTSGRTLARATPPDSGDQTEAEITGFTLPATGRYVIILRPSTTVLSTLVVQKRQSLLPSASGSAATTATPSVPLGARALVPKTPLQNGLTANDPVDYWTFNADGGSVVQIVGTRINGDLRLDMVLFGPAGYVTSVTANSTQGEITLGPVRLAAKGAYTLVVTRWLGALGRSSGGYRLVLSFAADASGLRSGPIDAFGRPVTGGLNATKPTDTWTFNGSAGDVMDIRMAQLDGSLRPSFELLAPSGNSLLQANASASETTASVRVALPQNGQYTIRAARQGNSEGGYSLLVSRVQTGIQASVASAEGIEYGQQKTGEITADQPAKAWVFYGKAGERAIIEVAPAPESSLDPYVYLLSPDGAILKADDNSGGALKARLEADPLPKPGFYAVVITASPLRTDSGRVGAFNFTFQQVPPGSAYQGQVNVGDEVTGRLTTGAPIQAWTFQIKSEQAGQTIAAGVESSSVLFKGLVRIVRANGQPLAASAVGNSSDGRAALETPLTEPGWYAVIIEAGTEGAQGDYRLKLSYALAPTGGGLLLRGQRGFGQLTDSDFTDAWHFTVKQASSIRLTATRLSNDLDLEIALYSADGKLVAEAKAGGVLNAEIKLDTLPVGAYTLIISRANGPSGQTSGTYTVVISE